MSNHLKDRVVSCCNRGNDVIAETLIGEENYAKN